jgi:hypothetical protein
MTAAFIHSFQSEWLKTKRSLAFWMVVIGGFFTPSIIIVARLINYHRLPELLFHRQLLEFAVEELVGINGRVLFAAWGDTLHQPDRADRI